MGMPDFNVSGLTKLSFTTRMLVVGNPPICLKAQSEELIFIANWKVFCKQYCQNLV